MKQRLRDQIRGLDPVRDHQRIVHLDVCFEFPFDTTRALEFALFRTYCVPGISGLLDRTGEFGRCPQKRYDDTDLIISEMMELGLRQPSWKCGAGAHEPYSQPFQDCQQGFSIRIVHLRVRADTLERALRLAHDV